MTDVLTMSLTFMATTSGAVTAMQEYVAPTIRTIALLAGFASIAFIVHGGYLYMTSGGNPEALARGKRILVNAGLGLILVFAALTITSILTGAYHDGATNQTAALPSLQAVPPNDVNNGFIDILIKAVIGFLNNIIQTVAAPFLSALDFFTKATPLMAENESVFNLWLVMVAIADVLFALVIALLGFHIMSAASLGFDEIEFKHLLPRIIGVFLLANTSIYAIDGIIELSNALIDALSKVNGASSVWETLTAVAKESGGQSVAGLLLMAGFVIFSVFLLVFYVGRLITLFIGAVLSPLVALVWLIPGFRDFSETAAKTYITTIFTLFIHVVILQLAASLFTGLSATSGDDIPDAFMSMIIGIATVLALLKTQSVMMQFSYVSMGARNTRRLGGQFMKGVSYMTGKGVSSVRGKTSGTPTPAQKQRGISKMESRAIKTGTAQSYSYKDQSGAKITHTVSAQPGMFNEKKSRGKTGTTYEAPKVTPRDNVVPLKTTKNTSPIPSKTPKNSGKDKVA